MNSGGGQSPLIVYADVWELSMKANALVKGTIALALVAAGVMSATAATVPLTTSDVSGAIAPTNTAVPTLSQGSYTYGNSFGTPTSTIAGTAYGFYDDFVFDVPAALTDSVASTISISSLLGIDNLRVRLYQAPADLTTLPLLGNPATQGLQVYEGWSSSMNYSGFTTTTAVLPLYMLAAGRYVLEVQGNVVGSAGGSYSGVLDVSPVPLPATLPLLLGGLGILSSRRRRRSVAS
jgi:hypothetical protein